MPAAKELPRPMIKNKDGSVTIDGFIFDEFWGEMLRWTRFKRGGCKGKYAVAYHWISGTKSSTVEYIHRVIMDPPKGMVVDHVSGDTQDCRVSNLRIVTQSQNLANRHKMKIFAGIRHLPSGKWHASVNILGNVKSLGCFASRKDAINFKKEILLDLQPLRLLEKEDPKIQEFISRDFTRHDVNQGIRYVSNCPIRPWRAIAPKAGRYGHFLGNFATREEAVKARRKYLLENGYRILE